MPDELRPPYVRFEIRTEEDREASIAEGHYVGKDVIFAIVTPTGSRDVVEKEVTAWLDNLREGVKQERIPSTWVEAYEHKLMLFKESQENPEDGAAIKDWPSATPSQIKTMLDIGVRTVEDLAAANEETLARIGMGSRALKQKAVIWLEGAEERGKGAERISSLEAENSTLKELVEELRTRLEKVEAQQPQEA